MHLQALGPDRFRICYQEGTFDTLQKGGNRIVRVEMQASIAQRSPSRQE